MLFVLLSYFLRIQPSKYWFRELPKERHLFKTYTKRELYFSDQAKHYDFCYLDVCV